MFATLFAKKKITKKKLAYNFVHHTLNVIDETYSDFLDAIYYDPELKTHPQLNYEDSSEIALIVIAGNIKYFERILSISEENEIVNEVIIQMAIIYGVEVIEMRETLESYSSFISRVNHPSKNILYGISKAIFFKFNLGQHQEEYFAQLNTPNPVFLKRIDILIENYIWDWKNIFDKNKITS